MHRFRAYPMSPNLRIMRVPPSARYELTLHIYNSANDSYLVG